MHLIIYFCGIENDNTYAKSCILYSKDVYISVTQSKYMSVCVRTCVWACVRACVCVPTVEASWRNILEHTNVHTGLCFGSCRIFCKGPSF